MTYYQKKKGRERRHLSRSSKKSRRFDLEDQWFRIEFLIDRIENDDYINCANWESRAKMEHWCGGLVYV